MSRIRTIKPEFWRHEQLSDLPEATHMLAAALLNYADDEGYFNANPKLVQAECCPLREPSVSIQDSLAALARIGYVVLGKGSDGRAYGVIANFTAHQRVNRPVKSKIKGLDIAWDGSLPTHTQLTEDSLTEKEREEEREGSGLTRPRAIPPSSGKGTTIPADWKPKDPKANPAEVKRFVAYNLANGTVKADWEATWDLWCSRIADYGEAAPPKAQGPPPEPQAWITEDDPRLPDLAARWEREHGRKPRVAGSRNQRGIGAYFPSEWLAQH